MRGGVGGEGLKHFYDKPTSPWVPMLLFVQIYIKFRFKNVINDPMVSAKTVILNDKTVLSLFDLKILLNSGRQQMFSKLASLSVSSLRKLDDAANKFYDWKHNLYEAALLTRCYTQHALRPYIDSKINHIRHFIKISFIKKGIEFIDLPSTFRDNNVISAIPSYFENTESPIICYKYNKPIRNTILNFNKLVSDLDIETSFPDSWYCKDSKFCYQPAGHIVTGN